MKNTLYLILLIFISCKKEKTISQVTSKDSFENIEIKYATGFEIKQFKGYKELILKAPYPNAKKHLSYILIENKNILSHTDFHNAKLIEIPIKKIVVTSTTHIPMLELLQSENTLVGFPNQQYISSKKTRELIKKGKITELGNEQNINTEILLNLKPNAVIGFAMNSNNKTFANIEKAGIPVILNGDWLEKTPLGRAEWLKFFGVLFQKEKRADSIFKTIEKNYLQAKEIAKKSKTKPKVLSGVLYKDKWNLPAGNSYVAQFLKDANVTYPWQNTKGTGSLSLAFESVLEKGQDADIWIAPGYYNSYQQLKKANQHYTAFKPFKKKTIYNFTKKKGETGGVLYYELAPTQPDIVLKDIIKIVHPELLKEYIPFYLETLE